MTLRRRWAISIVAILVLFGLNLAVYQWGNARRTALLLEVKAALERKDLVVEIRDTVTRGHRDAEVMEPLLASGAVRLDESRMAEIRTRLEGIGGRVARLDALSGTAATERLGASRLFSA